jgi:hypothetical protein
MLRRGAAGGKPPGNANMAVAVLDAGGGGHRLIIPVRADR